MKLKPSIGRENTSLIIEAFLKLSSSVYFDKQNLHLRHKLAEYITANPNWQESLRRLEASYQNNRDFFDEFASRLSLIYLPKSVEKNATAFKNEFISGNFYTNQVYLEPARVTKYAVFIDAPIELHVLSVLWTLKYGKFLDHELSENCLGNRLHLDKNGEVIHSRTLFYRYEKQYQKWWSDGIAAAKELFEKKEDVTIVNFDFKDYYHSIELDLDALTQYLKAHTPEIESDPLHSIFVKLHQHYASILKHPSFKNTYKVPIPIGLLSSYVLANWYLKGFDDTMLTKVNPIYYGRYVDDLMLVIKNTVIEEFSLSEDALPNAVETKYALADHYIQLYFQGIFQQVEHVNNKPRYQVAVTPYENIYIQLEKFSIYQFNAKLSPNLLNRYVDEQRERASAFQFLSDDEDDVYKDIDEIAFESNFDFTEQSNIKFKNLDDQKFKLSVYLAKLIRGSVLSGKDYNSKEIKKLKKYFKGYFLIKNYYFWEKLFSLWMIREEYHVVFDLYLEISAEIDRLDVDSELSGHKEAIIHELKRHLLYSLEMAIGLFPDVVSVKSLTAEHREVIAQLNAPRVFRDSGLLRKVYFYYPLLQFTTAIQQNGQALYKKNILFSFLKSSNKGREINYANFFPYRIKFYECCLFTMNLLLGEYIPPEDTNQKRRKSDFIDTDKYLNAAWEIFDKTNYLEMFPGRDVVKTSYFRIISGLNHTAALPTYSENVATTILKIPNSGKIDHNLRICVVNKYVSFADYSASLEGAPNTTEKRLEDFNLILDDIKKVPNCDLFIMPELALPYQFIHHYVTQTCFRQVAFITGLEHWTIGNLGFNLILSCFPLEVYGDKDAVPIFRVKNHYAPIEEEWMQGKHLVVPKPQPYRYDLIEWRGVYLSVYNCFELADVTHRHLFYGMVDVIFAPIWNPDMHYYNSLVETASRDMHCYFTLSNTTQYGDSRVIEPSGHIERDKLRVKGGTVEQYRATILVADLKIKLLRYFQTHQYKAVDDFNKKNKTFFKPLPPDFPFELAELRMSNRLFKEESL